MVDELLPGASELPVVRLRGEVEGAGDQLPVGVGLVGLDLGEQLIDEILMSFDYRHQASVPPPFYAPSPASGMRRNIGIGDEFE